MATATISRCRSIECEKPLLSETEIETGRCEDCAELVWAVCINRDVEESFHVDVDVLTPGDTVALDQCGRCGGSGYTYGTEQQTGGAARHFVTCSGTEYADAPVPGCGATYTLMRRPAHTVIF